MKNTLLLQCHIIRECFTMLAWPNIDINRLNWKIANSIPKIWAIHKSVSHEENKELLTIGIGLSIAALYLKSDLLHTLRTAARQWFFTNSMYFLLQGINRAQQKRWRAECAYWSIFTLMKNEDLSNDLICDAAIFSGISINIDNLKLFYSRVLNHFLNMAFTHTNVQNEYVSLFDTSNALKVEPIIEFVNQHKKIGSDVIAKLGCDNEQLTNIDYIVALQKAVSNQLSLL